MAGVVSLKLIGDWRKEIGVPLRDALHVSMDIMGRTGEEGCRHALILMAQSAAALTKQARKNRKMQHDEHGKYVDVFNQGRATARKVYEWMFSDDNPDRIPGTWERAREVGSRGLGKRSWMWGLKRLGGRSKGKVMTRTSRVLTITRETVSGYILENALSYITKILPAGWEATVALRAGNKIMAQARAKIERQWKSAMRRRERRGAKSIQSFFLKGL